jgi:hypothetical protein
VADLLECLLQIRGLHETATRVDALTRTAAQASAQTLAEARLAADALVVAERTWLAELASALPGPRADQLRSAALACDTSQDPLIRFTRARQTILEVLDTCTAADLAAVGDFRGHGSSRVADTIAYMLAHDVECLGALRLAVERGAGRSSDTPPR